MNPSMARAMATTAIAAAAAEAKQAKDLSTPPLLNPPCCPLLPVWTSCPVPPCAVERSTVIAVVAGWADAAASRGDDGWDRLLRDGDGCVPTGTGDNEIHAGGFNEEEGEEAAAGESKEEEALEVIWVCPPDDEEREEAAADAADDDDPSRALGGECC